MPFAQSTPEKPFRLLRRGKIRGPYSLDEIRYLAKSGQLREDDLLGVETWVPLATLGGLLRGSSLGQGSGEKGPGGKDGSDDSSPGDAGETDGALPVDREFELG